ncbi:MAG: superinfection immunity protein [Wenzhouxiangella sp.]
MTPFLLIPTVIGWRRGHPRLGALFALNTLGLAFFGIGWILALIWAITVPGSAGPQTRERA